MDNVDIVDAILEGLPESYSTIKVYLNMLRADKDTLVHSLLSEEQLRKKEKGAEGTVTALTANVKPGWKTRKSFTGQGTYSHKQSGEHKVKPTDECYYCYKKGHHKAQCRKR